MSQSPGHDPIQATNHVAGPARTPGAAERTDPATERLLAEQAAAADAAAGCHDLSSLEHNKPLLFTQHALTRVQQYLAHLLQLFTHDTELAALRVAQIDSEIVSTLDAQTLGLSLIAVLRGQVPAKYLLVAPGHDQAPGHDPDPHGPRPYRDLAAITRTSRQHQSARIIAGAKLVALAGFDALIVYLAVSWLGGGPLEVLGFTITIAALQILLSHHTGIALKEGLAYGTRRFWVTPAALTTLFFCGAGALVTVLRVAEVSAPVSAGYGDISDSALSHVGITTGMLTIMLGCFLASLYALGAWVSYSAHNPIVEQWMAWRAEYTCSDPDQLTAQVAGLAGEKRLLIQQRDQGLQDSYRHEGRLVSVRTAELITIYATTLARALAAPEATTAIEARTVAELDWYQAHVTKPLQDYYLDLIDHANPLAQPHTGIRDLPRDQPADGDSDELVA